MSLSEQVDVCIIGAGVAGAIAASQLAQQGIQVLALEAGPRHCRMGDDPRSSVVDQDLKVHGVDNLFVVGSSVFRTFGAIGPTLTIAALACGLRIKSE